MSDTKKNVTPSGVPYEIRKLKGKDQNEISKLNQDGTSDTGGFNRMLADCLLSVGGLVGDDITPKLIRNFLSNDRKFILVDLRQFTLDYQKTFDFSYEWPIQKGQTGDKEITEYSMNFSYKNFGVKPYHWVQKEIDKSMKDDPDQSPFDGYIKPFPEVYKSYADMLMDEKEVHGQFKDGRKFKWELLDGAVEKSYADVPMSELNINTPIEQRKVKIERAQTDPNKTSGGAKKIMERIDIEESPIMDLEHMRLEIKQKEGIVDTLITVAHPTNPLRERRVDIIAVPAFFFPSQAI